MCFLRAKKKKIQLRSREKMQSFASLWAEIITNVVLVVFMWNIFDHFQAECVKWSQADRTKVPSWSILLGWSCFCNCEKTLWRKTGPDVCNYAGCDKEWKGKAGLLAQALEKKTWKITPVFSFNAPRRIPDPTSPKAHLISLILASSFLPRSELTSL